MQTAVRVQLQLRIVSDDDTVIRNGHCQVQLQVNANSMFLCLIDGLYGNIVSVICQRKLEYGSIREVH